VAAKKLFNRQHGPVRDLWPVFRVFGPQIHPVWVTSSGLDLANTDSEQGGKPHGSGSHELSREPLRLCTFNVNGVFTKFFSGHSGMETHTRRQVFVAICF